MAKLATPKFRYIKTLDGPATIDELPELSQKLKRPVRVVSGYKKARPISLKNTLFGKYPYLKLYWDFEKNVGLNPHFLFPNSEVYAWWTCRLGHSVWMKVRSRVRFIDCRTCESMVTPIEGSLLELHPEIAKEWDFEKNYPLLPIAIKPCKREKVWWICTEKGHSYAARPYNRVRAGSGCKRCASSKPRKKRARA